MKYNLSFYEIGARYAIAMFIIIPAALLKSIPLVILGMLIVVTALLGMCPIKTLISNMKHAPSKSVKTSKTLHGKTAHA